MTLATHGIVGAAAALVFPDHPLLAFVAAFISHFAIDAIPHWDYRLLSARRGVKDLMKQDLVMGKKFWRDMIRIGSDFALGMILPIIIFRPDNPYFLGIVLIGSFGGILPDPLQFVYFKLRPALLKPLQQFHLRIHADSKIENPALGAFLQLLFVIAILLLYVFTGKRSFFGV